MNNYLSKIYLAKIYLAKIYLACELADHRRGRFLSSLLNTEPVDKDLLPETGILLFTGEHYQSLPEKQDEEMWKWCRQPGRVLLILPPYRETKICINTDWTAVYRNKEPDSANHVFADKTASEVIFEIQGQDGEFSRELGHEWSDFTINTRFIKQHSSSGIFAATCLPLWSISLLDNGENIRSWLEEFYKLAGKPSAATQDQQMENADLHIEPEDYSVLVCCYAWDEVTEKGILNLGDEMPVSVFDFEKLELSKRLLNLKTAGYIDNYKITKSGVKALELSPFWIYAQELKEAR
ncbi:Uncharacterized protein dnl_09230 [Desulfonema limicola]|uniref:Uncharacterized protein n=1 Tax=Desulfonema limicola TaxID=45656 RepID=A0A975B4L7_9BACT|nr:hypothetical protein [Desulfonema limicola]QTA78693.1 Uncharacterized protein dnl_09230 [Desulfonema limicola]